jgi:NAD(P)-dependent dehydrogenase (short-subunit alcohol dehydrogenase family)
VATGVDIFDLTGRVALVTGATRGMGRAMATGFAEAGADVIVVSRKADACEEVATDIAERTGRRTLPYPCHVGHWEELDRLTEVAYAEFGRVDVLVNNAGMSPTYDRLDRVTEALYDKVLDVNLKGPFRLTALIGTRMAEGDGGSIINVSSYSAIQPDAGALPYSAAKAGVNALTVGFAHAFGPKVRVNCIQPGAFLTDISEAWDMDEWQKSAESYALGRGAEPSEVVGTALYLASDASSYTTAAIIRVDGGNR